MDVDEKSATANDRLAAAATERDDSQMDTASSSNNENSQPSQGSVSPPRDEPVRKDSGTPPKLVAGENDPQLKKEKSPSKKLPTPEEKQQRHSPVDGKLAAPTTPITGATTPMETTDQPLASPSLTQSQQTPPQMPIAAIPENILSPPKSETQTDETNTATSSSSPASGSGSDSQMSPAAASTANAAPEVCLKSACPTTAETTPPAKPAASPPQAGINVVANGTIPLAGKPQMAAMMNKKLNTQKKPIRSRKPKATVALYESEISDNKVGIKLCIKKSEASPQPAGAGDTQTDSSVSSPITPSAPTPSAPFSAAASSSATKTPNRKRSRKSKAKPRVDSDDSEYEVKKRKDRAAANNSAGGSGNGGSGERQKKVSFSSSTTGGLGTDESKAAVEQTKWGYAIPEEVLIKIFKDVVDSEGCLPALFRLGKICSQWRRVSLTPSLWRSLDLSTLMREKARTELKLKWFIDNRCRGCTDLNVSNWKVSDINCFLHKLAQGCPNLQSITLAGWKNFTSDHLAFLVDNLTKLQRLDLSSVNVEMNASKSAVGLQSLCNALQTMGERLTHLYLAHNRLAGLPQLVNILSTHCPNLLLLDLSNVTTQATSHGVLHIEKLQRGCQKLKVLRVTNSHITPSTATMQEMMDAPGFPDLEELSVAVTDESRLIGDEHLQRILKTSSKLKLLDVRGCTRLTHESLIRLPAWDIKHLFLSGCSVTRDVGSSSSSGLELIASKWAHSLIELDLAWANVQEPIDNALRALAEKGSESPLAHLNLCGSSVSEDAVKEILAHCSRMSSINLSSCRGLPRGVKRLMKGPKELKELRDVLRVQVKFKLPSPETEDVEMSESKGPSEVEGGKPGGVAESNHSN